MALSLLSGGPAPEALDSRVVRSPVLASDSHPLAVRTAPKLSDESVSPEKGDRVKTSAIGRHLGVGVICRML